MQTTNPKKLIGQTTSNLERLTKELVKELYIAGSILDLVAQEQKEFHEAKSQIAARAKTLEDINGQIAAGHAELERQAAERAEVNKAVRDLKDEHRRLNADLEQPSIHRG